PPPAGWVAIEVAASGMCRADLGTAAAEGADALPVVPGHEVAGTIGELGDGAEGWRGGDRVAGGWLGGRFGRRRAWRTGGRGQRDVPRGPRHGGRRGRRCPARRPRA